MAKKQPPKKDMKNGEQLKVEKGARRGVASATAMRQTKKRDPANTTARVVPYVLFLLGVLFALFLLVPEEIPVSGFFCGVLRGGFSYAGWLVPVLLFVAAFRFRDDYGDEKLTERVVFSLCTLFAASALCHLPARATLVGFSVRTLYTAGTTYTGGGMVGGLLYNAIAAVLGLPGVLLICGFGLLFSALMLFGITPWMALCMLAKKLTAKNSAVSAPAAPTAEQSAAPIAPVASVAPAQEPQAPAAPAEVAISPAMMPRGFYTGNEQREPVARPVTETYITTATDGARSPFASGTYTYHRRVADPAAVRAGDDAQALVDLAGEGDVPHLSYLDGMTGERYEEYGEETHVSAPTQVRSPFAANPSYPTMPPRAAAPAPTPAPVAGPAPTWQPPVAPATPVAPTPTPTTAEPTEPQEAPVAAPQTVDASPFAAPTRPTVPVAEPQEAPVPPAPVAPASPFAAPQEAPAAAPSVVYTKPPLSLLPEDKIPDNAQERIIHQQQGQALVEKLLEFKVPAELVHISNGPTVLRFELKPGRGVSVNAVPKLANDIACSMRTKSIRIQLPVPGKDVVGIELPNPAPRIVGLRALLEHPTFQNAESRLTIALGRDVTGEPIFADIAKMPHLLVAGQTGSGKSVCMNAMIISLLYKSTPEEVRLILIDPKRVELAIYNGLPHLLIPVVTDMKKAAGALRWAVGEMDRRSNMFSEMAEEISRAVPNLAAYNRFAREMGRPVMPQIVIFIDELADLMMTASGDVEASIQRLTQLARAMGIYLVIGTQRPSVDVITGVIKSNIPSRIAFQVASNVDSRTILDRVGAEKLLMKGDMLYAPSGEPEPIRVQGAFVDGSEEVSRVVQFIKKYSTAQYDSSVMQSVDEEAAKCGQKKGEGGMSADGGGAGEVEDELFWQVLEFAVNEGAVSASAMQRRFSIGYNRAARLLDKMYEMGFITETDGAKPRKVLLSPEQFYEFKMGNR